MLKIQKVALEIPIDIPPAPAPENPSLEKEAIAINGLNDQIQNCNVFEFGNANKQGVSIMEKTDTLHDADLNGDSHDNDWVKQPGKITTASSSSVSAVGGKPTFVGDKNSAAAKTGSAAAGTARKRSRPGSLHCSPEDVRRGAASVELLSVSELQAAAPLCRPSSTAVFPSGTGTEAVAVTAVKDAVQSSEAMAASESHGPQ
ncbi:hypothetical protein PIB30_023771 [Stylosanthes scabra]|uniref:Uncharacterized protein n=1 Tax=Stylosanthes scabra TaxID=79078 RepID=A0ABU6XAC7_9FABA|nr:hypothetical protein [Stylosanthes scabra]